MMLQGNLLSSPACLPALLTPPHVPPHILHEMYSYVLWWAANLVATPQPKLPVGSPSSIKVRSVPVEQALRVLEASTLLLHEHEVVTQVMAVVSPQCAPASVLALRLA